MKSDNSKSNGDFEVERKILMVLLISPFILFFCARTISCLTQVSQAQSWPTAQGIVIKSQIDTSLDPKYNSENSNPSITYQYSVDGQTFQSSQLQIGGTFYLDGTAHSKIKQYPLGKSVLVHYRPDHPAEAVLELSSPGPIAVGVLQVLSSLGLLIFVLRLKDKPKAEDITPKSILNPADE